MWITDQVELPPGLIAAQQRGDLVVFVGAGASIDAPSSFPSFAGLTERIASDAGVAPPTGSVPLDFFGIVYLHGSVRQHPRFLVVSDRDFGRAYLTEAWAARFLDAMFRRYVVSFVGYSHDDVVMTYLARALPSEAVRFAMTPSSEAARWRRLGTTPIPYPVSPTGGHGKLVRALTKWAEDSHMGLLDLLYRLKDSDLVARYPEEAVRLVTHLARGSEPPFWGAASSPPSSSAFAPRWARAI